MAQRFATDVDDESLIDLETFVALVAHEMRTPLAIVKTAVETLAAMDAGGPAQPGIRRVLFSMVERNVDLALLLVDRMSLAREIERGTVALAKEPLDLVSVVKETIADLRGAVLREHPVELVAIDTLVLEADPTAVREMVFNLLSNAAKYSAQAAPISVAVDRCDDNARVVVRDRGVGVTRVDTEHIFDKFVQTDAGSSGMGLGLFVSRGLARAHGGNITVRPAEQVGSEFLLELPVAPSERRPGSEQNRS